MWFFIFIGLLAPEATLGDNSAAEMVIVEDARDGALEQSSLLEAALTLSGIANGQKSQEAVARFTQITSMARINTSVQASDHSKALQFVKQMHLDLLRGEFDPESDGLEEAFSEGKYNCVISLILALEFCRREGISAHAMQYENHVWLRVGENAAGDVETTKLQFNRDSLAHGTRITDVQLLTRLLYNQARRRHQQNRHDQAAQRLEWCLLIDPTFEPAVRNLRIVLGNWTAAATEDFRFSEAIAVNAKAMTRFPEDAALRQNAAYLKDQWAKWLEKARVEAPEVHPENESAR